MTDRPVVNELSDEDRAWLDYWIDVSVKYHERLAVIQRIWDDATAHQDDCDVCAHTITMVPKDVPEFDEAFARAGPVLSQEPIAVGIWSFPRRDFLWHESGHGS